MGPFTVGPVPEVRMRCGPVAGLGGERLLQKPGCEDALRTGSPRGTGRSGDSPSVACPLGGSRGEGLGWFQSHPSLTPTQPSSQQPCLLEALLQFLRHCHSCVCLWSRDQRSPEPHSAGTWAPAPRSSSATGTRHVQLRTEHQMKKRWSLSASLACAVSHFHLKYCRKISHL